MYMGFGLIFLFILDVEFSGTGFRSSCLQGLFHFFLSLVRKTNADFCILNTLLADASVLHGRDRRCA